MLGGTFCVAFGRRYYTPELGRWINRDPIGENGGTGLLAFCGNNAMGHFDPLGLKFEFRWSTDEYWHHMLQGPTDTTIGTGRGFSGQFLLIGATIPYVEETGKVEGKKCCRINDWSSIDITVRLGIHKLKHVESGGEFVIGYIGGKEVRVTSDVYDKMHNHELGHVADFEAAFASILGKRIAELQKRKEYSVVVDKEDNCCWSIMKDLGLPESIEEYRKEVESLNNIRDGKEHLDGLPQLTADGYYEWQWGNPGDPLERTMVFPRTMCRPVPGDLTSGRCEGD